MFEKLGIYGMERVESAVLSGLVTGDPVLLIGSHGTGKTLLCHRLAQAMGMEFWAYDASKALFEDVLGFPDPSSLASGRVEYVPTSISIWGKEFVLVDELSRANPSMQNKWLEVIRSRRIMGKGLDGLKFVIAAMNPPTYIGAHPLDAALAGRFALVVPVPEVSEMENDAVSRIVQQVSEDDAPMLGKQKRRHPRGADLMGFIEACRERANGISATDRNKLSAYVIAVNQFLASREIALDGRRLGMVHRSLQAYLAVEAEKNGVAKRSLLAHDEAISECLSFTMPFAALGESMAETAIKGAHFHAKAALDGGKPRTVAVLSADPMKAADDFIEKAKEMLPEEQKSALTRILSRARSQEDTEQKAPALLAVVGLATAVCDGRLKLEPDDQYRVLGFLLESTMIESGADCGERLGNIFRVLRELLKNNSGAELSEPAAFLGFRLGCMSQDQGASMRNQYIDEQVAADISAEVSRILNSKGGLS